MNKIQQNILDTYNVKFDWFITLTYRYEMTNTSVVGKHIKQLVDHLKRVVLGKHRLKYFQQRENLMMIGGIERHADGSIHIHLLLKKPKISIAKDTISSVTLDQLNEEVLCFWEDKKRHSFDSSTARATNHCTNLITKSDSQTRLEYATKFTSELNSNFFLAYWDQDSVVLPTDCIR